MHGRFWIRRVSVDAQILLSSPTIMASAQSSATAPGANAAFKDKVCPRASEPQKGTDDVVGEAHGAEAVKHGCCERWVQSHETRDIFELIRLPAISDAVRTSLGPRGMDKMVKTSSDLPDLSHLTSFPDPNRQRRGYRYQRWSYHSQEYPSTSPRRQNGSHSIPLSDSGSANLFAPLSWSICRQHKT